MVNVLFKIHKFFKPKQIKFAHHFYDKFLSFAIRYGKRKQKLQQKQQVKSHLQLALLVLQKIQHQSRPHYLLTSTVMRLVCQKMNYQQRNVKLSKNQVFMSCHPLWSHRFSLIKLHHGFASKL